MTAMRLLAAPLVLPPSSEVSGDSVSLVAIDRIAKNSRATGLPHTSYPEDQYVWSVAAGKDGSYLFYAAPRDSGNSATSGRKNDFSFASSFVSDWTAISARNAVSNYALHASTPTPSYGHLLDVYA
jgi:hypothetical protein